MEFEFTKLNILGTTKTSCFALQNHHYKKTCHIHILIIINSVNSQLQSKEERFEKWKHMVIICVPSFTFELTPILNVSKIPKFRNQSQFDQAYACINIVSQKKTHLYTIVCRKTFAQINYTSPETMMYNFKGKHSHSSRTIIAIFFKLTIEKLTKFRNVILHGSFIYNCRCNLYYYLTSQELEHLCLLECHNASDRTRRE